MQPPFFLIDITDIDISSATLRLFYGHSSSTKPSRAQSSSLATPSA